MMLPQAAAAAAAAAVDLQFIPGPQDLLASTYLPGGQLAGQGPPASYSQDPGPPSTPR